MTLMEPGWIGRLIAHRQGARSAELLSPRIIDANRLEYSSWAAGRLTIAYP